MDQRISRLVSPQKWHFGEPCRNELQPMRFVGEATIEWSDQILKITVTGDCSNSTLQFGLKVVNIANVEHDAGGTVSTCLH